MPVTIAFAYLIGSIPFALLLARRWGAADLRQVGSGNLGAANVLRSSGVRAGLIVALLDIAKGAASVLLAERLSSGGLGLPAAAGFAAIVGHVYPVWLRFRGGKGVATACGVFSMLTPLAAAPALGVFLVGVSMTRYISVGSVLASLALPPMAYATGSPASVVGTAAAASALVVFRHRSNLARLRDGTERRIGMRVAVASGFDAGHRPEA
jgi:glycerol-3-phosphate acyltransferase PlsY